MELKLPGGPERWRVISVAAGGRHSMVLALPDNGNLGQRQVEASVWVECARWTQVWASWHAVHPSAHLSACSGACESRSTHPAHHPASSAVNAAGATWRMTNTKMAAVRYSSVAPVLPPFCYVAVPSSELLS